MNIKGMVTFSVDKLERSYSFQVPIGAPWSEAIEVLEEFIPQLKQQQSMAADQEKKMQAQAAQSQDPVANSSIEQSPMVAPVPEVSPVEIFQVSKPAAKSSVA